MKLRLPELAAEVEAAQQAIRDLPEAEQRAADRIQTQADADLDRGTFLTDAVNDYLISAGVEDHDAVRDEVLKDAVRYLQLLQERLPETLTKGDPYGRRQTVSFGTREEDALNMNPGSRKTAFGWAGRGGNRVNFHTPSVLDGVRAEREGKPNPFIDQKTPGYRVPEASDLPLLQYVLTHESATTLTLHRRTPPGDTQAAELARVFAGLTSSDMPSGYSLTNVHEMVAEAFTAWMWGDRTNPTVAKIASIMGWDQEYIPPPDVEPPEEEPPEEEFRFSRRPEAAPASGARAFRRRKDKASV